MVSKHIEQHMANFRSEGIWEDPIKELEMITTWILNQSQPGCEEVAGKRGGEREGTQPKTMLGYAEDSQGLYDQLLSQWHQHLKRRWPMSSLH
jgi:hypothetical protein